MEVNDTILVTGILAGTGLLIIAIIMLLAAQLKIKKLKRLNDALKTTNSELEKIRNEISKEIQEANQQSDHVNKALERSKEEFNSFSYSISHDLKAPIRAINGFCAILMEEYYEGLDENGKKTIATIQKNAAYVDNLISDLLEISRLGTLTLRKQKFYMQQLVEQVLSEKANGREKAVKISPMEEAYGDVNLMRQVWGSLIGNAIKFSSGHQHNPAIEIGYKRDGHEQLYWIRDNGVGFDPAYTHKLFKVFSRLHTKKEFEGTGAGLVIAKKIIEAHDGRIWAEGELLKGAIFYFTLPAALTEQNSQG